ncbi:hypothetical protein VTJ49DRAFT_5802 [Mycothermus thermophilus]|uniref:Mitochondrial import inner membrane translocase subunit n=1 Tax=Humicola insolens TaxID=85995 RepID=A0ABR3VRM1_HUMIN
MRHTRQLFPSSRSGKVDLAHHQLETGPENTSYTNYHSQLNHSHILLATMSESEEVKKAIIKMALSETNTNNARQLMTSINRRCFDYCVPNPGSSLSDGEQQCINSCMEKYIKAWNEVNAAYLRRIQQEVGNNNISIGN